MIAALCTFPKSLMWAHMQPFWYDTSWHRIAFGGAIAALIYLTKTGIVGMIG